MIIEDSIFLLGFSAFFLYFLRIGINSLILYKDGKDIFNLEIFINAAWNLWWKTVGVDYKLKKISNFISVLFYMSIIGTMLAALFW